MADLDEILRLNPRAAARLDSIRETIDELNRLRAAGIARGPSLTHPAGGYKSLGEMKSAQRRSFSK